MNIPPEDFTPERLRAYEVLERMKRDEARLFMTKVGFWAVLVLFVVLLIAFFYAAFGRRDIAVSTLTAALDATLGFCLRQVYKDLFPGQK